MPDAATLAPPVVQPTPPPSSSAPDKSNFYGSFGLNDPAPAPAAQSAPPVAAAPAPAVPEPAAAQPAAPAAAPPPVEAAAPNPYLDLIKPPPAPAAWSDDVVAAFKARGIDDIDAVLTERKTLSEQLELQKKGLEMANQVLARENELDEFNKEIIRQVREGKNVREWLASQPNLDLSKPADKQDKVALVKAEYPQAISAEDEATLKDPDADPERVADILKRIDGWVPLAAVKFEERRKAPLEKRAQDEAATKAWNEKHLKGVAASVASLPESMKTLATPEVVQAHATGKLIESHFYEADGTYKPTSLADALWLRDREKILKTAHDVAYAEGLEAGELKSGARLSTIAGGGRELPIDRQPAAPTASDNFFKTFGVQP